MLNQFSRIIKKHWSRLLKKWQSISYLELFFLCFIIGITIWGYYDTLDDFFIMDDFDMIRGHSTFKQFLKHWHSPVGANSYRPLIDLLFIWDFFWWKWNPVGWHLSDLLFHIFNTLLVYGLAKHLLKSPYAGMVAGVLFGLHTSHTEAVTWISARMDPVSTTFFLLSVRYFISSTGEPNYGFNETKKQKKAAILSLVFFGCALLVKEMAVTLPFVIILYDLLFATRWKPVRLDLWKKTKIYLPYFLVLLLYFVLRFLALYGNAGYSSKFRSGIGGYDVDLFGAFIFENIVWYFKFLAIPFVDQIFSPSLLLNFIGITIVTCICLILSKESRFAILWIFITLIPVYSFHIGRGVYLASVGFCILMGMLLTFSLKDVPIPYKKALHTVVRLVQMVIIVALFYRYGVAIQESNAWWSRVAEINENVPLMVKTLYPTFPKQAKICLQNMPLVPNQRFNSAFHFRYPDSQFAGIYAEDFEKCAEDKGGALLNTYFFHYDKRAIHDLTYETREKLASQPTISEQKLFRDPGHNLSAAHPQLHLDLNVGYPCSSIGIVSSLANGIEVPEGTVVARGRVEGEHGFVETFEFVAGRDTAEWAFRFPQVRKKVQHTIPQVYRAWTVQQPGETFAIAQNYIKHVTFQAPFVPITFFLEFIPSSEGPSNLVLDVNRIVFYGEKEIEE